MRWYHLVGVSLLFAVATLLSSATAFASQDRVALVIGNSTYEHVSDLSNPLNDATDIAGALKRIGFTVTHRSDLDFGDMRLALRDFSEAAADAEIAVIYFAGHGIEIDNSNYLIPVDARLQSDRDVDLEAVRLDTMIAAISDSVGLKVILVDACRNNPFISDMASTSATRSVGRGLARIEPGAVLVGYAARGGTLALDGEGRNSPYAQALLQHIEEPGLEIGRMFRKVRTSVLGRTDGQQEPYTYGSLPDTDIFLVPPDARSQQDNEHAFGVPAEIDAQIADGYDVAERGKTLEDWQTFVTRWETYATHPLVRAGQRRMVALRTESAKDQEKGSLYGPWIATGALDAGEAGLSEGDRKLIQTSLGYMGLDVGTADGAFGPSTRNAILAARIQLGLPPGVNIDQRLIDRMPNPIGIDSLKSRRGRSYRPALFDGINEPRLEAVGRSAPGRQFIFDYYEGRLYVVIQGHTRYEYAASTARSLGGHLVTIGDPAEHRFVASLFSADERFMVRSGNGVFTGPMIGLVQADQSSEPAGGWKWVTGEDLGYSNWADFAPNDRNRLEQHGSMVLPAGRDPANGGSWQWDDTPVMNTRGFIIEIE